MLQYTLFPEVEKTDVRLSFQQFRGINKPLLSSIPTILPGSGNCKNMLHQKVDMYYSYASRKHKFTDPQNLFHRCFSDRFLDKVYIKS